MSLIKFENVVKKFNGVAVLDGLSFDVEKGEVLALVGPSGTGKSVTLKHLVRLLTPTSGKITVDGIDVSSCSSKELTHIRSRIGYLFQGGALLAWMSVAENVALPLRECTNLKDSEIDEKVAAALASVELSAAAEKLPSEISGGMQKRAGLARAIVRESDIVLYDEPTSGLDPVTSVTINRLIKKLNKELGITSIVVTHDLQGALNIADRILLIKEGKAIECSKPEEFVNSQNPAVKEFLAAMKGEIV
ncbi:MAG: ATP-binding cassette domain-containing protein [Kiritimatiellae bacterium]|nr:ATP-binding cassette domain-containing protein [Kiritimatiellia bacterium]